MDEKNGMKGVDRRQYIRYTCKTEFRAIVDFDAEAARKALGTVPPIVFHRGETATVRNISTKGISLELDHFLPPGMTMKMAIANPITAPIQTGARIMWSKMLPGPHPKCIVGLAFRYMREKHRRNLQRLIEFLQSIPE